MSAEGLAGRLSGGRRQSLGEADAVAAEVVADPELAEDLWDAVRSDDPVVASRAVDALEKASRERPQVLVGHGDEVLGTLPRSPFSEVRWHVGPLVSRLDLTDDATRARAADVLDGLLRDPSRIGQALALDALVTLADQHPDLSAAAEDALSAALESPSAAVRARARRLLRS